MASGISISIASDTREFDRGVRKGIIDPLDDAADALDDLGKDGTKTGDKLERAMRDAQKDTEKLGKEATDLGREMQKAADKSSKAWKDSSRESSDEVKDNLNELGDEARSNAAEMFSSFDGSFESIADAAQGTLGGVVGSLGPIGAAAGAAGAIGLGLVTAELTRQQEEADAVKQALTDAYKSAAEEGRAWLDEAHIIAAATDILFDSGKYENAVDEARRIGIDVNTYIRGQAGSYSELKLVIEATKEAETKRLKEVESQFGASKWKDQELATLGNIRRENENLLDIHEQNRAAAHRTAEMQEESERRQREQIQRTRDADQARWEARMKAVEALPSTVEQEIKVKLTPDTSAVDNYLARPRNLKIDAVITPPKGKPIL